LPTVLSMVAWTQECKFMIDDHVESVYYNGQDITANVEAFNSQAKKTKMNR